MKCGAEALEFMDDDTYEIAKWFKVSIPVHGYSDRVSHGIISCICILNQCGFQIYLPPIPVLQMLRPR